MKTIPSKPSLTGEQFELDQLLATNKSLAQEKRQLHRQKLRQYSEKAVKLQEILRSSIDSSERKCLEGKLRALQQKQDIQITKLAKIDQIEKQIDEYMTEENEDLTTNSHKITKNYHQSNSKQKIFKVEVNENTPAKKLKQRDHVPLRQINQNEQGNHLDSSIKSSFLGNSSGYRVADQYSNNKCQILTQFNKNQIHYKDKQISKTKNYKQSRVYSCWEPNKTSVERFKPKNNLNAINHAICEDQSDYKISNFTKDHYLREEEQKNTNLVFQRKQLEENIMKLQKRVSELVEKERNLMQRIDGFEKQQSNLIKKNQNYINSIQRSRDIILSSGLILEQLSEIQINNNKASHQFSIDSLESQGIFDGSLGLSMQLASFEKMLQQFLLSAERQVMLTSGELQQCGLKINRIREQCTTNESKKRNLQNEILKLEQNLPVKKKELNMLEDHCRHLKQQVQQFDHFSQIKKKLVSQLQEKCQRLKVKKKVLSQKVQKIENELQTATQQYSKQINSSKTLQSNIQQLKDHQKQLQEAMIFAERELERLEEEKKEQESKLLKLQSKLSEGHNALQKILLQISQHQKRLVEIQAQITSHNNQQNSLHERIRKIERQLNESASILDEQRTIITNQNDQINTKSNELLDWQKKIIAIADSHRALQAENAKFIENIRNHKQQIEQLKSQRQEIQTAKVELEEILSEVITRKEALLSEVDLRSSELETLLTDLFEGHEQLKSTSEKYTKIESELNQIHQQYASTSTRLEQVKEELEEKMEEETNIIARINKLKLVQRQLLLQIGLKGPINKLDEQLKSKVSEAISQLQIVNKLKSELKQCKYENRKLKLDNQRLSKFISTQNDSTQHI